MIFREKLNKCKVTWDSLRFWISRCWFRIPGTWFWIPCQWNSDSRFLSLAEFRIAWAEFRIPKPMIPDFTSKNFSDFGIRLTFHGGHITYFLVFGPWCTFLMVCLVIPENEPWAPRLTALVPQNPDDCSRRNRIGIDIILTLSTNSVNRNYITGTRSHFFAAFLFRRAAVKKINFYHCFG